MSYKIEMLSLGDADSFILEYFDEFGIRYIVLIDAGKPNHGEIVANHLRNYYKTDRIDLAVSTHLDSDHIGGFPYIINNFKIDEFWIHDPRIFYGKMGINNIIKNAGNSSGLRTLRESVRQSKSLNELLDQHKEIKRTNPEPGLQHENIPIKVLGPSIDYYREQLRKFKGLEILDENLSNRNSINQKKAVLKNKDIIDKDSAEIATNSSSIIMLFEDENCNNLFTADAGIEALDNALQFYEKIEYEPLSNIHWFNVPHHGSIKNLSSKIIEQLSPFISFISASGSKEHPSEKIIEALASIGSIVYSTSHSGNTFLTSVSSNETGFMLADPISDYIVDANDYFQEMLIKSVFRN